MRIPFFQVDAFTSEAFKGNPAAVCVVEEFPSSELMQTIAAENNLAETAFVKISNLGNEIKWFTPVKEVPLCGHATVASAAALYHGFQIDGTIKFNCLSGEISVTRKDGWYTLDFPSQNMEVGTVPEWVAPILKIQPKEVLQLGNNYLFVLDSEADVLAVSPEFDQLKRRTDIGWIIVTAPGDEVDFVSRFFATYAGIDEDHVTGSAHTRLMPYWAKKLGANQLTAKQVSKRGGFLKCRLDGQRVLISGQAKLVIEGELFY